MNLKILLTEGEHNKAFYNTTICVLCYCIGITLYSVKTYLPMLKLQWQRKRNSHHVTKV